VERRRHELELAGSPRHLRAGRNEHVPHQPKYLRCPHGSQHHQQLAELARRARRCPLPVWMSESRAVPDDGERLGRVHGPQS
jgi:hypothetical protein